jgi:subtilisin family serine protease
MQEDLKEYVVILKSREDLESFYAEMESTGGTQTVPDRRVEVANKRPMSRSTHYMLTQNEAATLANDPRVLFIQKPMADEGAKIVPLETFNKGASYIPGEINWGLFRCFNGQGTPNWGWGLAEEMVINAGDEFLKIFPEGKNVDVVISDGIIDPNHPEMKSNPDGTGPSRVIQYNWFQHNPEVANTPAATYTYNPYDPNELSRNDHGMHVAGIACGITQGWARKSNIYNISPHVGDIYLHIDYIRAFHKNKPINPKTGRKNPTIVNCSWGAMGYRFGKMRSVRYRNQTFTNYESFTETYLRDNFHIACEKPWGVVSIDNGQVVIRDPLPDEMIIDYGYIDYSLDLDILDAINEGVIFVGAAGNLNLYCSNVGDVDWNNEICFLSSSPSPNCVYTSRGMSPGAAVNWGQPLLPTTINVGAVGEDKIENRAPYSNIGPRVDIYAPGTNITSSILSAQSDSSGGEDPKNNSFFVKKLSGTSMASPQVCGILACMLEKYPNMNQWRAREFLFNKISKSNQLTPGTTYQTKMPDSNNQSLSFPLERAEANGTKFPDNSYSFRRNFGAVYPRKKNKFFK